MMKRKAAFIAVVALLLAYDKSAKSHAQPPDWLFSGGTGLSAPNAQIWPESKSHPKIASRLTQAGGTTPLLAQSGLTPVPLTESLSSFARFDQQGRVEVYITLDHVNESTLNALRDAGVEIEIYAASQRLVQGWITPPQVQAVADLPSVTFVDLPNYGMTNAGSVMTQGDAVIRADQVRAQGITGNGVKVGVISGGVNGLTSSIASGDLPATGITMPAAPLTGGGISLDSPLPGGTTFTVTPVGRSDLTSDAEGTALLEIIHDIAPDAQLFFAPVGGTTLAFQRAVRWLTAQGVKVVADDVSFFNVGPYDGTSVVSQEASNAVAGGVSYFHSVGNYAQQHYRGLFTDTDGDTFHEFDVSLGLPRVDNAGETLNVTIQPGATVRILLQWNDPFGGSTNDYDLCVHDPADIPTSPFVCSTHPQTGTQNPTEGISVTRIAPTPSTFGVSIHRVGGAAPRVFDLFILGGVMNEFVVPAGSVPNGGDAGGGVISVGAVNWQTPNAIEFFSSRGPTSDDRVKPELVAPDGVATSVVGFASFFGTSAAAPHAAGAAALVLGANPTFTPAQLSARLTQTAVPLDSPIPNNTFGFGRIDAFQALSGAGATPTLAAAVLPASRSVQVGAPATALATIINLGPGLATGCGLTPAMSLPATFSYQTTDPSTNALTGSPNTPVDIAPSAAQSFVFALTPTSPIAPTDVPLSFACTNTAPAPSVIGL
ncbi:MAG: S8 family serine peptidase, partial [candidate division NC10 bacterium]|nr:S8 family serine peptidase [candidate division NC10 bacterium]